ncbi:hypothetical protein [Microtetraspora sp. NBRC 16547]|uniref:hypothetical protein n=1 Tax=Microtetraspora sp. NBRC 16547 TaxID=3030993 RepID=UPI002555F435|nr:hypothetical protein [Microtetraspora sp. NBRC 16547]
MAGPAHPRLPDLPGAGDHGDTAHRLVEVPGVPAGFGRRAHRRLGALGETLKSLAATVSEAQVLVGETRAALTTHVRDDAVTDG